MQRGRAEIQVHSSPSPSAKLSPVAGLFGTPWSVGEEVLAQDRLCTQALSRVTAWFSAPISWSGGFSLQSLELPPQPASLPSSTSPSTGAHLAGLSHLEGFPGTWSGAWDKVPSVQWPQSQPVFVSPDSNFSMPLTWLH